MAQSYKIHLNNTVVYLTDARRFVVENCNPKRDVILKFDGRKQITNLLKEIKQNDPEHDYYIIANNFKLLQKKFFAEFTLVQAGGGLVIDKDGNFLVIHRRKKWDLPKGKLEGKEGKKEGAVREVEEETNVKILRVDKKLIVTYHTYNLHNKHMLKKTHWYLMLGDHTSETIPQKSEGIKKAEWVNKKGLKQCMKNTFPSIKDVVAAGKAYLKNPVA